MINIFCPMCGKKLNVQNEHIGAKIRCKNCLSIFIVEENKVNTFESNNKKRIFFDKERAKLVIYICVILFFGLVIWNVTNSQSTNSSHVSNSQSTNSSHLSNSQSTDSSQSSGTVEKPNHPSYPKPSSGTELMKYYGSGLGELSVENGTNINAILKLVSGNKAIRIVYISSHDSKKLSNISDGEYSLYFALGNDFDPNHYSFYDASTSKFEKQLKYQEIQESNGTTYNSYSITLQAVLNGNARTSSVNKQDFNNLLP